MAEKLGDEHMATTAGRASLQARANGEGVRPSGGVLFNWAALVVGGMLVGGFYLDAWAHSHGKVDNAIVANF